MEKASRVQASWPTGHRARTEEHTIVIKFDPCARPRGGDVTAVQAARSVGPLQWKRRRPRGPHEQPVDKTQNLESLV